MTEFLAGTLPKIIAESPLLAYGLVLLGGIITSIGPCNLSMVPAIIGYVAGQEDYTRAKGFWLSVFFTLGSAVTFMLLGIIAALVGVVAGRESRLLHWFAAAVCFLIGLVMLGALKINFDFLARLQPKRVAITGPIGAFFLGLVLGIAGSQCATPFLVALLGLVAVKGKLVYGASLLFAYALGRGVPIVLAGTFTGVLKALPALEPWTQRSRKLAGIILIAVGLYLLWIA